MAVSRLKKDDNVLVIAGRERGKTGKVLKVIRETNRVVVERVNLVKKHQKPRGMDAGGIIEKEAALHQSNVLPICGRCNKATRVGHKKLDDGRAVRLCRRCGEMMDAV